MKSAFGGDFGNAQVWRGSEGHSEGRFSGFRREETSGTHAGYPAAASGPQRVLCGRFPRPRAVSGETCGNGGVGPREEPGRRTGWEGSVGVSAVAGTALQGDV